MKKSQVQSLIKYSNMVVSTVFTWFKSTDIRCEYTFPESLKICILVWCDSALKWGLLLQNSPKDLDLSYETDLDL